MGHRLRQLHEGPDRVLPAGLLLRPEAHRAALALDAPTSSRVPVLALIGGADPQDPLANLADLKRHFPDSRTIVFPHIGHEFRIGGCIDRIIADFVDRATTKGLDSTRCDGAVVVPPFALSN